MDAPVKTPVITMSLSLLLLAFSFLTLSSDDLMRRGALDPLLIRENEEWYRLFTALFLHADLLHMLVNVNLLYLIGLFLERWLGSIGYGLIFLGGGIGGNIAHVLLEPLDAVGVGASGSIYALLATSIMLMIRQIDHLERLEKLYLYLLILLGASGIIIGIILNFLNLPVRAGNWAHIGGLIVGVIAGAAIGWYRQRGDHSIE